MIQQKKTLSFFLTQTDKVRTQVKYVEVENQAIEGGNQGKEV